MKGRADKGNGGTEPCSYQLGIWLDADVSVRVGALGLCHFAAGAYVYTGSARRNMEARLRRHCGRYKRRHWHVDYLLASEHAAVLRMFRSTATECDLNRAVAGTIPAAGFGATDCRQPCGAHLKYLGGEKTALLTLGEVHHQ